MYGKTLRANNISVTAEVKTNGYKAPNGRDRIVGINMMECHIYNKKDGYKELANLKKQFIGRQYRDLLEEVA